MSEPQVDLPAMCFMLAILVYAIGIVGVLLTAL
jgi:hypothetical protein